MRLLTNYLISMVHLERVCEVGSCQELKALYASQTGIIRLNPPWWRLHFAGFSESVCRSRCNDGARWKHLGVILSDICSSRRAFAWLQAYRCGCKYGIGLGSSTENVILWELGWHFSVEDPNPFHSFHGSYTPFDTQHFHHGPFNRFHVWSEKPL